MKIIKAIEKLKWVRNENGGAYYKDYKGKDWYEQRNQLASDKPIIVVDVETDEIHMLWTGDPTMVSLPIPMIYESVNVYQLDEVDITPTEFLSGRWKLIGGEFIKQ